MTAQKISTNTALPIAYYVAKISKRELNAGAEGGKKFWKQKTLVLSNSILKVII